MIKKIIKKIKSLQRKKEVAREKLAADIAEAREDVKAGRLYSFEEICEQLGLD